MENSHIQQSGIPKLLPGSLGIPNNSYTKRSKKRIKHQKISKCSQRAKVSSNNKKIFDLEAKKWWR